MAQFVNNFFLGGGISSIFVGFFKSSLFLCHPVYIEYNINILDTISFMRIASIEVTMFMEQEGKRHSCHCRIRNTTVNMHRLCHSRRNLRNTS